MKITTFEDFDKVFNSIVMGRFPVGLPVWYSYEVVESNDASGSRVTGCNTGSYEACGCDQSREIQVDVIEDEKNGKVKLVAEIPGVEKKDISVTLEGREVVIKTTRDDKSYDAKVSIKQRVSPDSATASYRNGILEIVFNVDNRTRGKTVRVN